MFYLQKTALLVSVFFLINSLVFDMLCVLMDVLWESFWFAACYLHCQWRDANEELDTLDWKKQDCNFI